MRGAPFFIMLNKFIKNAYQQTESKLPTKQLTIRGVTITATYDTESHYSKGALGGFEPEDVINLTMATSYLPVTKKTMDHEIVQIDGIDWRIHKITIGDVLTQIDCVHPDHT